MSFFNPMVITREVLVTGKSHTQFFSYRKLGTISVSSLLSKQYYITYYKINQIIGKKKTKTRVQKCSYTKLNTRYFTLFIIILLSGLHFLFRTRATGYFFKNTCKRPLYGLKRLALQFFH